MLRTSSRLYMPYPLSDKQIRYAELRVKNINPTKAARLAGYRDAGSAAIRVQAFHLEHNPKVQQLINCIRNLLIRKFRDREELSFETLEELRSWKGCSEDLSKSIMLQMMVMASKLPNNANKDKSIKIDL